MPDTAGTADHPSDAAEPPGSTRAAEPAQSTVDSADPDSTAADPGAPVPDADAVPVESEADAVPVESEADAVPVESEADAVPGAPDDPVPVASAADAGSVASSSDGDPDAEQATVDAAAVPADAGELAELAAVLDDGSAEPRRHWLRYPGLFGALTVVALVILVPCGAGILFFTGAFADHGAYAHAPDACARLTVQRVDAAFGAGLVRGAGPAADPGVDGALPPDDQPSGAGDESSCTYLGGAASGRDAQVTLTLTRYDTKGPLSAPRMAHAGFTTEASGARDRTTLPGLGDEAVRVISDAGTSVLVRRSNLVLRLDAAGDIEDPRRGVTTTARAVVGSLR